MIMKAKVILNESTGRYIQTEGTALLGDHLICKAKALVLLK